MSDHSPIQRPGDIPLRTIELSSHQSIPDEVSNEGAVSRLAIKTVLQLIAAGFSYFFAGTNDGSLGAVTPYILRTYSIGTQYVAIMYAIIQPTAVLLAH